MPSERAPFVSVVVCTRNRAELLEKALLSLADQDIGPDGHEILLVDNASTDATPEVARRLSARLPLRYLREERIGLCIARNRGWRAARGEIVAYFDDDAVAEPGWLAAIRDVFRRDDAGKIGIVGGPVVPIWLGPRPDWLEDPIACSLTIVDWGKVEKAITDLDREWLVGANMAIPHRVLEEVDGFHPSLDRIGDNLLSGGDVHLAKKIIRRGYECRYLPAMAIRHLVPPARLERAWFTRRFYWQGVSDAVMVLVDREPRPKRRLGLALRRLGALLADRARLRALIFSGASARDFTQKCFGLIDLGFIMGLLGVARR
ncbi:glycosyltransferase [Rubrimonas sp.]|uniref:glycosyltransferase n=1 Tax=Rubrimonas sp. TaxID=2036015 RepID=UPI002FDE6836